MKSGLVKVFVVLLGIELLGLCLAALMMGPDIDPSYLPMLSRICIVHFGAHLLLLALTPGIGVVSMPFLYAASLALYVVGAFCTLLGAGTPGADLLQVYRLWLSDGVQFR